MSETPQENDANITNRAFQQFLEMFVRPEIERRQAIGSLPKPVDLKKFQIIWFPDRRGPEVRINEEVKGRIKAKLKDGVAKNVGDPVLFGEIEIEDIAVPDCDNGDCAHATYLRSGNNQWWGKFDAIYNKGLAAEYLKRGDEFLFAAKYSLENNWTNAFLDTLFSAAELFAKSRLLLLTEFQFREKSNHKGLATRFNYHAKIGNIGAAQREAFNTLSKSRYPARYLDEGQVTIDASQAATLVAAVESIRNDAAVMLPQHE